MIKEKLTYIFDYIFSSDFISDVLDFLLDLVIIPWSYIRCFFQSICDDINDNKVQKKFK